MKYNYVILGSDWDLYKFSYSDLKHVDYAQYVAGYYPPINTIKGLLYRIHFSPGLNRIVNLPLKNLWNKSYFKIDFKTKRPLCFLVFSNWICHNIGITEFLRSQYKDCKIVWISQDLISTLKLKFTDRPFEADKIKGQFDLVLSFDPHDCRRYGFTYHPLVFSSFDGEVKKMPMSDIYMLAQAKNRLKEILDVYEVLRSTGLKLDIHITGVEKRDRKYEDEIDYLDGKGMSYAENLQHVLHTRCILEIMQKGGAGFTQRGCEAVCLDKKLLTNNAYIRNEPFYNPEYISSFSSPEDIDMDFIRHIKDNVAVDYGYKEKLSPVELLNFIDNKL